MELSVATQFTGSSHRRLSGCADSGYLRPKQTNQAMKTKPDIPLGLYRLVQIPESNGSLVIQGLDRVQADKI